MRYRAWTARPRLGRGGATALAARAVVAVEDRRFRSHMGVDWHGVLRAAFRNVVAGGIQEGASTIPMQLTRVLWEEPLQGVGPWHRKIIEARTAPRLVRALGRDRVLTLYLNAIYLGNGVYGVARAAEEYFGVPVDSLDVGRLATLVGMTRAPERYDPRRHPARARARRDVVLNVLATEGIITRREADDATSAELRVSPSGGLRRERSYLTAAVTRELRRMDPGLAATPGLHVFTTIDTAVQAAGERALARQLGAIESGRYGVPPVPDDDDPLQGAAVALDPTSGAVRAWIGGRDFGRSEFDRVDQARRSVGSLVKPFLAAAALERGLGMVDLVSADTVPVRARGRLWLPADHVGETVLPLREALIRSSNRAAVHLGRSLGFDAVRTILERAGVSGPVPAVPSTFIGAFDASLLEMTAAFAAFGNGGFRVRPHLIRRVEDGSGTVLWRWRSPERPRVLDPAVSFVVLDALAGVVDLGTGAPVRRAGYRGPAAAKTGTSDDVKDAWIVGLTPRLVSGVWIGRDRPWTIVASGSGGVLAGPAWARWMSDLEDAGDPGSWTPPAGVVRVRYDRRTGRVVEPSCEAEGSDRARLAWVRIGTYVPDVCRGSLRRWAETLWRALLPKRLRPVSVTPLRNPRGGGG